MGTFAASVSLRIKANKQAVKAVELYNLGLGSNLYQRQPIRFEFGPAKNGIGILVNFQ